MRCLVYLLFSALVLSAPAVMALSPQGPDGTTPVTLRMTSPGEAAVLVAEEDSKKDQQTDEILPGTLLLPDSQQSEKPASEKRCMTVCARWGEECLLLNRGAGGMERKCRRTCKQFAEECF